MPQKEAQKADSMDQSEHTRLNDLIAEKIFGWKWMSWVGRPTRDTPDYPTECRVRQFMPPNIASRSSWQDYFAKHEGRVATGDEPLEYSYGSSKGCVHYTIPDYLGADDYLVLERLRETWIHTQLKAFVTALVNLWLERRKATREALAGHLWAAYRLGDYSRAALIVLKQDLTADRPADNTPQGLVPAIRGAG